jgi:hypothetical protein
MGDTTKMLFGVMIAVLLLSVIGLALRSTIVGNVCSMTDAYSVTYANASGGADVTENFPASGIRCNIVGLLYTWGLVLAGLGSIIGLIYVAVKQFK